MASSSQTSITKFFTKETKKPVLNPNESESNNCIVPDTFLFPYEPYGIQQDFMRKLYETLDEGKLGIFESPTGTGKSLSIICATLTWLHHFETNKRQELEKAIKEAEESENKENEQQTNDSDWFESCLARKKIADKLSELRMEYGKYQKLDSKIKEIRERKSKSELVSRETDAVDELYKGFKAIKKELAIEMEEFDDSNDEEFVLKEYVSDEEYCLSSSDEDDKEEMQEHITKIYFCSRTHSQLSQFAKEVRKSPFAKDIRLVSLGSRQNFCVNDDVQKLKSLSMMNDRCRELQKNKGKGTKVSVNGEVLKKKKSTTGCPFYRQTHIQKLSETALADVTDIEELVKMGRNLKACPYYGSRYAQQLAQLVLLPYNTLLHKQTREASGVRLKGNVVIVDEAHNLLDAISSVHSSYVTGVQLSGALSQLSQYKDRYSTRLKAKNVLYIQQIVFILKALLKYLRELNETESNVSSAIKSQEIVKMLTLNEFVLGLRIDNINLFKILHYCQKSEIATKLLGFSTLYQPTVKKTDSAVASVSKSSVSAFLEKLSTGSKQTDAPHLIETEAEPRIATSPLMQVVEFFRCLTNDDKDGRIVMTQHLTLEKSSFKYYLLNPAAHFGDIVSNARAVIVAGGTMQPVEEFSERLFQAAGAEKERIVHFSCGHVIPSSHLLAMSLSQGPSGLDLKFSYQNRNSVSLIDELGKILTNICNIIPGGIICFFASYDYEMQVLSQWEEKHVLSKIGNKKKVFKEPRKANETSKVLSDYSKCILSPNNGNTTGAILFCVVGGKMSEGINFSDDLGRCVAMVGMPYPNIKSLELQEKMSYLNSTASKTNDGQQAGQTYYENLCMKAVNQSIGRAIRHKEDYATILLLDTRYSKPSIQRGLPTWIRNHLKTCSKFGPAFGFIRKFFNDKKA